MHAQTLLGGPTAVGEGLGGRFVCVPLPSVWGYKMPLPTIPAPTSRLCLLMAAEARARWWLLLCLWKSRINPLGPHSLPPLPLHICLGLTAGTGQHIQAQTAHLFA